MGGVERVAESTIQDKASDFPPGLPLTQCYFNSFTTDLEEIKKNISP